MATNHDQDPDDQAATGGGVEASAPSAPPVRPLRREALVVVHDRGRAAILAGALGIAGLGLGFGLATLGTARRQACSGATIVRVDRQSSFTLRAPPATPWLGVVLRDHRGRGTDGGEPIAGARIMEVMAGTAAERAGLRGGEVVMALDGRPVTGASDLIRAIRQREPGDEVAVAYLDQAGERRELRVALGEMDGWAHAPSGRRHIPRDAP
jgi:S1-C subfamily serine protease